MEQTTTAAPPTAGLAARQRTYALSLVLLLIALAATPFYAYHFDVFRCWVPWATASGGVRPWAIYRDRPDCNYPPALPYLWTATAAAWRWWPALRGREATLLLLKLPNLLAWMAGVPLCAVGLRVKWGDARATAAATAYALCLPLMLDAAVWGQYDAIVSLAMVAAVVAAIDDRPRLAGAVVGLALAIKLQAIVVVPALIVYGVRRFGIGRTAQAACIAAAVVAALAAPYVLAGQGRAVRKAYVGAVDFYPKLTMNAGNLWQAVRLVDLHLRHLSVDRAESDAIPLVGPVTPKRIGLALLALYSALICAKLWRRPNSLTLARGAGLTAFGFFMLATQMHERYLVVAVALLALPVGFGPHHVRLYVALAASAAAHLVMQQYHESLPATARSSPINRLLYDGLLALLTPADLAILAWATWRYLADGCVGPQPLPIAIRSPAAEPLGSVLRG